MPLTKAYLRYRGDVPDHLTFTALEGFRARGIETAPFYGFGDVETLEDLGPEVGVVGYMGDVHQALRQLGKTPPKPLDYPEVLQGYLGRAVYRATLGEVYASTQRFFVKPLEPKLFTGFLWNGPQGAYVRLAGLPIETDVWISEIVEFLSEYRVFVLDGQILDVRRYKGVWSRALNTSSVEEAVATYCQDPSCPKAFCLDLGVTPKSECCLVEANSAYSFGHYGLRSELYAQMLESSWQEMTI